MDLSLASSSAIRRARRFIRRNVRFTRTHPAIIKLTPQRVDILGRGGFAGPSPVRLKISRDDPSGLCFGTWIRASRAGREVQTLLDFVSGEAAGAALELRFATADKTRRIAKIHWRVANVDLTHAIPVGRWVLLFGGYHAFERRCWLSIDGEAYKEASIAADPFAALPASFFAGLGCRLSSRRSDFMGTMHELGITSAIDGIARETWQRWAKSADPNKVIVAEAVSRPREWPAPWFQRVVFDSRQDTIRVKTRSCRKRGERKTAATVTESETTTKVLATAESDFAAFVARAKAEDAVGVAYYFGRLIETDLPLRVCVTGEGRLTVELSTGRSGIYRTAEDLMAVDSRGFHGLASFALRGMVAGAAQTFYRRAERPNARALIEGYQRKFGADYFLTDVDMAQSRHEREGAQNHPLVRTLACGSLEYLDYFKGKYCGNPFGDFEVRSDGEIFVCCPSYLPHPVGNLNVIDSPHALRESPRLKSIHASIRDQTFQYCRWLHCEKIMGGHLPMRTPLSSGSYVPRDVRLSYDPSCNLWCPSCRTEKMVLKRERQDELIRKTDDMVLPLLKSARTVMLNGYGDIFSSRVCRHILGSISRSEMPDLRLRFISNGVIFSGEWEKFPNIHDMVESIRVSVDAAQECTYERIRLGGDWRTVRGNLEFISKLRQRGRIENFSISFVVQKENFTEMADFALLGQRLKCDEIIYEGLLNWNTYGVDGYRERAVHFSDHPLFPVFREEWARVEKIWAEAKADKRALPALSYASLVAVQA